MGNVTQQNRVLLAMVLSMVFGYMPWYNFSAVLNLIAREFSLSATDTGAILAAFQAGYVAIVPLTGWLADRVGLKRMVFWATLLTGVSSMLFAWLAHDRWSILVLRLITGLSAGAIYAPGLTLLSRWFPASTRGMALGAYTGALVTAYAGGYFIAGPVAAAHGWRAGIFWTSLPAIFGAGLIQLAVQEAQAVSESSSVSAKASSAIPAPRGGYAGPILITLAYFGHMWEQYAFWGWIGPYLASAAAAQGMPEGAATAWAGRIVAFIILLGAPASLVWGIMADKKGRIWAMITAGTLSLVAEMFIGYMYRHSLWLTVLIAGWIGFWVVADSAIYKVGLAEMVDTYLRATYLGVQSAVGFSATIVAPLAFSAMLRKFNGNVPPLDARVWGPAFMVLGAGTLLVPLGCWLLRTHPQAKLMGNGRR